MCLWISLLLLGTIPFSSSYSLQEIIHDSKSLPFNTLISFRGSILSDIWIHKENQKGKNIQVCRQLFDKALENVEIEWPPPKSPPNGTVDAYTIGGKSVLQHLWTEQRQNGGSGYHWGRKEFEDLRSQKKIGCGLYSEDHCDEMILKYQSVIENKTAIVVGSQSPWAEASLFNAGARHVTTIEYMKISTDYPNYSALHPSEVARKYLQKSWSLTDFAYSYSSLEHDGLGRYGDPLNPFGDLESLARIRCLLRPGGTLFLSLPVAPDTVVWNLHRIYGRYRLGLMLLGWNILDIFPETCDVDNPKLYGNYMCQPLLVLQKPFLSSPLPSAHS
jgi:hypothetical protein